MSIYDDVKAMLRALEDIRKLQGSVDKLNEAVDALERRLILLEEREERLVDRAESAAREAAMLTSQRFAESVFERVLALENRIDNLDKRLPPPEE